MNQLYKFITDETSFSIEHFVISESKEHLVRSSNLFDSYEIDRSIYNKYVNNFFNFIFIDQETNSMLSNFWLPEKIEKLDTNTIKCEYSKMVIRNLSPLSKALEERAKPDYKDNLDLFFTCNNFP